MTWRVAYSLETLRAQFNAKYPTRNKESDGGIGDADHANRSSDHNPWVGPARDGKMLVTARDYTHDPAVGMDIDRLTDELAASRDPRIKYVIANGWILDSRPGNNPWKWTKYYGTNSHSKHFHLSVMPSVSLADDARAWNLPSLGGTSPTPEPSEDDDLKADERKWLLEIHKFLYEAGFIANRLDPQNPTKGADMIPDMASWAYKGMKAAEAAKTESALAAKELTMDRRSAVPGSFVEMTSGEFSVQSDKNDFENAQRLDRVERQLSELLTLMKAKD